MVTADTSTPSSEISRRIADIMIEGFDRHYRLFRETSANAKQRFDVAAWTEAQQAVSERIRFYDERVRECVERLNDELDAGSLDDDTWRGAKLLYIGLLVDHKRPELAETFFNSVVTRVLRRTYVHNDFVFVRAAVSTEYIESDPPIYRSYYPAEVGLRTSLLDIFADFGWKRPFADLERDVGFVWQALLEHFGGEWPAARAELPGAGARLGLLPQQGRLRVGKIVNGNEETPFAVRVLHDEDGRLVLDTVLFDPESISVLFELSRAYFMVDMDVPSGYVQFLQTLMPAKPRSELYTVVGLAKQGKTLFFRDLLHHLHHSRDVFVEAPGTRGLVMHVFTLPSYPYVFKVIKDEFGHSKHTDRATVKRKFLMVKEIDRVGRMADTLEFKNLALPRDRFAPELLDQLLELAPSTIEIDGDNVIVGHCYVERRMTPLNLYLETATRGRGRRGRARVRRHDPGAGDRERLRRRHALAQLRRQPPRPRRLLRLRRDRVPDRLRLPQDPAAAEPRGGALGRAVVSGRAARRLPGGVRDLPAREPAGARGVPAPPRRPAARRVLAAVPGAGRTGRDRGLLPVPGGDAVQPALRSREQLDRQHRERDVPGLQGTGDAEGAVGTGADRDGAVDRRHDPARRRAGQPEASGRAQASADLLAAQATDLPRICCTRARLPSSVRRCRASSTNRDRCCRPPPPSPGLREREERLCLVAGGLCRSG